MTNEETVELLNDLLTKAYDAEQGYEQAAKRADEASRLRDFCLTQSSLRLSFGHEIKSLIKQYGGEPDKGASIAGKTHQAWIAIKDAVSSDDEEAILEECIRGEEAALEEYNEKLQTEGIPADVATAMMNQRNSVADALQAARIAETVADAKN